MACPDLAVHIEDLHFEYPDGTPGLRGVCLSVPNGMRMALLGPNGAGKSTLLWHINGLIAGRGTMEVLGRAVERRHVAIIRQQVGLLFQNPEDQLFMPTVYDEVAYGALNAGYDRAETDRRVRAAMAAVGVEGLGARHPARLSVGQKKRVALASVLVTDNRVLLLDEPSAALDPAGRRDLIALLDTLESTMLIATHDLDLAAALCEQAAVMAAGQIVRVGATTEVLADEASLRRHGL